MTTDGKTENDIANSWILQPNATLQSMGYNNYMEVITQLREIVHKLQLRDATQRTDISRLKKVIHQLRYEKAELEAKVAQLEELRAKVKESQEKLIFLGC